MIIFVQSYQAQVQFREAMPAKEHILWEQQGKDDTFRQYSDRIKGGESAVLVCVIGGKLSEGINFSDGLARTVLVLGLPFPNNQSVSLQQRMQYFDSQKGGLDGRQYYENLCMRVLNQAIGRALRHKDDYACIVIVDSRIMNLHHKLPYWVQQHKVTCKTQDEATKAITDFYMQNSM